MTLSIGANNIRTSPNPNCYVCGANGQHLYAGLRDHLFGAPGEWNMKKCPKSDCGLIWLDPAPIERDIGKAYERYYTHGKGEAVPSALYKLFPRLILKIKVFQKFYAFLQSGYLASSFGYVNGTSYWQRLAGNILYLLPSAIHKIEKGVRYVNYIPRGRLLDVGCGDGTYLEYIQNLGWEVVGLEVDSRSVELGLKRGLAIHHGTLEQQSYPANHFDIITLNHVIEHIYDPLQMLRECHRVLKPGGFLMVFTPNSESAAHSRYKESWRGLEPPRHILIFTCNSLASLSVKAGFNVQVRTSAGGARGMYIKSAGIAKHHRSYKVPPRLLLSFKGKLFSVYESLAIFFGKDWGEEIILIGLKE